MRYNGIAGTEYIIGEKIAGGGEGSIHELYNNKMQVAKLYKPERRSKDREDKLCRMVEMKLTEEQLEQIIWPQDVLYNNGIFVGYIMPKLIHTDSLTSIYNGSYDLRQRLLVAINMCYAIQTVHDMNQVCGDLNPQNICINLDLNDKKNAFKVTLVDTDSYHIISKDTVYRCEVGLADYIAPEIQKKMAGGASLKSAELPTYTRESDLFALAIHIFALLMNGCHPFACAKDVNGKLENDMDQFSASMNRDSVVAPQPIDNIKDGFFPFYHSKDGITYPIYAPAFQALPETLQKLFERTFVDGYLAPTQRVTASEWAGALLSVKDHITACTGDSSHFYFRHNTNCPLCAVNDRIQQMFAKNDTNEDEKNTESSESAGGDINSQDNDTLWKKLFNKRATCINLVLILFVGFIIFCANIGNDMNGNSGYNSADNFADQEVPDESANQELTGDELKSVEDLYNELIESARSCIDCGDYNNAVLTSDSAIAYLPERGEAYYLKALAFFEYGDCDKALETVNQGLAVTTDQTNFNNLEQLRGEIEQKIAEKLAERKKLKNQLKYGKKILKNIKNKKYSAAVKLINKGDDKNFFSGVKKIYIKDGKLVDTIKKGKGFVYYVNKEYAYYGQFKNGKASGKGFEIGDWYTYYTIDGTFKNGYPNGKCTFYCHVRGDNRSTYIGTYKNGWENGSFTWIQKDLEGGHSDTYYFSSSMGTRKVIEMLEGDYVFAKAKSGWVYYTSYKSDLKDYGTPNTGKKK